MRAKALHDIFGHDSVTAFLGGDAFGETALASEAARLARIQSQAARAVDPLDGGVQKLSLVAFASIKIIGCDTQAFEIPDAGDNADTAAAKDTQASDQAERSALAAKLRYARLEGFGTAALDIDRLLVSAGTDGCLVLLAGRDERDAGAVDFVDRRASDGIPSLRNMLIVP